MNPRLLGIATDVGACSLENLAVDINPRSPRRVLCLAEDVCAVVDAIEVDRPPIIADPIMWRRCETRHGRERRPTVNMRHHFIEMCAGRDVIGPPHDTGHAPSTLERTTLLATKRGRPGIWIGIQPRAIVGGDDHNSVGRVSADFVHNPTDIGIHLHQRVGIVAEMRFAPERGRCIGWIVHLDEVDIHEERLVTLRMFLDVADRRIGLPDVEFGQVVVESRLLEIPVCCLCKFGSPGSQMPDWPARLARSPLRRRPESRWRSCVVSLVL
jgi:hypothetical protein